MPRPDGVPGNGVMFASDGLTMLVRGHDTACGNCGQRYGRHMGMHCPGPAMSEFVVSVHEQPIAPLADVNRTAADIMREDAPQVTMSRNGQPLPRGVLTTCGACGERYGRHEYPDNACPLGDGEGYSPTRVFATSLFEGSASASDIANLASREAGLRERERAGIVDPVTPQAIARYEVVRTREGRCNHTGRMYICTRRAGHTGPHCASDLTSQPTWDRDGSPGGQVAPTPTRTRPRITVVCDARNGTARCYRTNGHGGQHRNRTETFTWSDRDVRRNALDVFCTFCNADPGEPCTNPSNGGVRSYPHLSREDAANPAVVFDEEDVPDADEDEPDENEPSYGCHCVDCEAGALWVQEVE